MKEERTVKLSILAGFGVLVIAGLGFVYGPDVVNDVVVEYKVAREMPAGLIKRAEAGDNEAVLQLGDYYIASSWLTGDTGSRKYLNKGEELLLTVKPPHDGIAMIILGCAYKMRKGEDKSCQYFERAIDIFSPRQDEEAYYWLNKIYAMGFGTDVDEEKAAYYLDLYQKERGKKETKSLENGLSE